MARNRAAFFAAGLLRSAAASANTASVVRKWFAVVEPSSTTRSPSVRFPAIQRVAAGTSTAPAGTFGGAVGTVGSGVVMPRMSSGVKEGLPLLPPTSVPPNTQASTSPGFGVRAMAPSGL